MFEITVFRKARGILTKAIALGPDGLPKSDKSACRMSKGVARSVELADVFALAALIEGMKPNAALSLGSLKVTPLNGNAVPVVTARMLGNAPKGTIARTRKHIVFKAGRPGFLFVDHDRKGMPPEVEKKLNEGGSLRDVLGKISPKLIAAEWLERRSTSAGLSANGRKFSSSGGAHLYFGISDRADIPRATVALHQRAWLAGLGWILIGAAGQLLVRSIVDPTVGSSERLIFEAPPVITPPLSQDAVAKRPKPCAGVLVAAGHFPTSRPMNSANSTHWLKTRSAG